MIQLKVCCESGDQYFRGYKEPWHLENAVQEVFARAFSDSARTVFDGLRPYKNYLAMIARNYIIDSFRKDCQEASLFVELPETTKIDDLKRDDNPCEDPQSIVEEKQMKIHVEHYISMLDENTYLLFKERFLYGKSIEASAKALEVTEYWIKREEKKVRKDFFVFMRKHGYFEGYGLGDKGIKKQMMLLFFTCLIEGVR
ncbi:MAG: sigma-70 family RNA polymerase sigma factor [Deltaproteobacteria bacterium]|nr:sigma-70 family RNA polymerase sigma factor [Deltaproteobacteria bacterium]